MKYIIVTGGVTSSLGKGIVTASIGRLLKARGFSVALKKIDPYLNVNPGTLDPCQHGEVFVTADGCEADLDLGHYERFTDIELNRTSEITTGKIYGTILERENIGYYKGSTIQVIPHVTDEIKNNMLFNRKKSDVTIIEIGGTVGDIEGLPFLEAARQLRNDAGKDNVLFVHVTLVPTVISEIKTKPTQHSVKELRSAGIQPDILICRTEKAGTLSDSMKQKISNFCNVDVDAVFENSNVNIVYALPAILHDQKLDDIIVKKLLLPQSTIKLGFWEKVQNRYNSLKRNMIIIGIIGKYVELPDAYLSTVEAIKHTSLAVGEHIETDFISLASIQEFGADKILDHLDGVIVTGTIGETDIEETVLAIEWAQRNNIPCFGIDLGMHAMCVSAARSQGLKNANSVECNPDTEHPIVTFSEVTEYNGDRRRVRHIGDRTCHFISGTKTHAIYNHSNITECHRCKCIVNLEYRDIIEKDGLKVSAMSPYKDIIEAVERKDLPWFIGVQYHPEFRSRPDRPHPLFLSFIRAVIQGAVLLYD